MHFVTFFLLNLNFVIIDQLSDKEKAKEILSEKGGLAEENILLDDDFAENGGSELVEANSASLEKTPKIDVLKSKSFRNDSEKKSEIEIVHISGKDENSIKAAAKEIKKVAVAGDLILLKGSRGIGLERLIPLLEGENGVSCKNAKKSDDAAASEKNVKNSENDKNAGAEK